MKRREFLGTAAAASFFGIPVGKGLAKEEPSKETDLTPEEVGRLLTEYGKLIAYAAWKIKRVYDVVSTTHRIEGGIIDPDKPIWGRMGEWTTFTFEGKDFYKRTIDACNPPSFDSIHKNLENGVIYAAEFWKKNRLRINFESFGFKTYIREVLWQSVKKRTAGAVGPENEGVEYEDGPWAEGWEHRCGLNPENLPVIKFGPPISKRATSRHMINAEEILKSTDWDLEEEARFSALPNEHIHRAKCKIAFAYLRKEDALVDPYRKVFWGKVCVKLFYGGVIRIDPTEESNWDIINGNYAYNPELAHKDHNRYE
jgi:hypothetical protein